MRNDIRLNNPFNIEKNPSINWLGSIEPGDDKVFCTFTSPEFGLRAGFINIKNQIKEGYNTITKIITKYAPPSENDTGAYISAISKAIGINKDTVLVPNNYYNLGLAIITHEQGTCIYTATQLINAVLAALDQENSNVTAQVVPTKPSMFSKLLHLFLSRKA